MKQLIRKILKENEKENEFRFYEYIKSKLKLPYFKNINKLIYQGIIEKKDIEPILSLIFNEPIKIKINGIFNKMGNLIYRENSYGNWGKYEFDKRGNQIYYENSDGYWEKTKYNERGDKIYREGSDGFWEKYKYNKKGNLIYWENFNGFWEKYEYDERGNLTNRIRGKNETFN